MKGAFAAAVIIGLLAWGASPCIAQQRHRSSEQRVFGAEDESFKQPFVFPRSILDILSRDAMVVDSLQENGIPPENLPASWFQASAIHLAGPTEQDVVVMGHCPVCGANVTPFWVFRPAETGYNVIFFGGGLALSISRQRSNGYLDLETSLVSTQKAWRGVWRFDGSRYRLVPENNKRSDSSN
jgi:hypothetical protein